MWITGFCQKRANVNVSRGYIEISIHESFLLMCARKKCGIRVGWGGGGGGVLNLRNTSGLTLFGITFTPTALFSEKCKISTLGTFSNCEN